MVSRFARFLTSAALLGLVLIIVMPIWGVIVAGLLFPIILTIGLPTLLVLTILAWIHDRLRK